MRDCVPLPNLCQSGDSSELAPGLPCKGKSVRNRGVSQTMPFLVIPRSLLRGGFILLIDQTPTASMLVLLTCRPYFQPAWHHRSYLTEITVHRLSHAQVEQIVNRITDGKTFPAEILQQILTKTDGVPLFVEELTKAILESGQLKVVDGHYELVGALSTLAIPATLQDSLMARLDRLMT